MHKTFQYRLFTTPLQSDILDGQLAEACRLYNGALQERRDAWKQRVSVNYYTQAKQLKEIRAAGDLGLANFSCCQDILRRVDQTYQAFLLGVKRQQKAGFPRFKSGRRFDSITFPRYGDGIKLNGNMLRVQGLGQIEVKLHRPIAGAIKGTTTVKRECGNAIGIDLGLEYLAALTDGPPVPNPRYYQRAEAKLRRAQQENGRSKKGSCRRSKAVALLQKVHARIRNQRNQFQHRLSFWLIKNYGTIVVEDLHVKGLAGGLLAKSVQDASWAALVCKIAYKAENAGRTLIQVDPRGTRQTCICGETVRKVLSDREHLCTACGLIAPRDMVSAQVILQRARISPSRHNVEAISSCVS